MSPPQAVVESIRRHYPEQADGILRVLQYDSMMQCWFFWLFGMYHGVEQDGYIHT